MKASNAGPHVVSANSAKASSLGKSACSRMAADEDHLHVVGRVAGHQEDVEERLLGGLDKAVAHRQLVPRTQRAGDGRPGARGGRRSRGRAVLDAWPTRFVTIRATATMPPMTIAAGLTRRRRGSAQPLDRALGGRRGRPALVLGRPRDVGPSAPRLEPRASRWRPPSGRRSSSAWPIRAPPRWRSPDRGPAGRPPRQASPTGARSRSRSATGSRPPRPPRVPMPPARRPRRTSSKSGSMRSLAQARMPAREMPLGCAARIARIVSRVRSPCRVGGRSHSTPRHGATGNHRPRPPVVRPGRSGRRADRPAARRHGRRRRACIGSWVATIAVTRSLRTTIRSSSMIRARSPSRAGRSARRPAAASVGWPAPARSRPAAARRPTARAAGGWRGRRGPTRSSSSSTRRSRSRGLGRHEPERHLDVLRRRAGSGSGRRPGR